jgi:hypothetical protein
MATIMPEGEAIKKALKWISAEREGHPRKLTGKLVDEAVLRFDLSPKEAQFLVAFYREAAVENPTGSQEAGPDGGRIREGV